MVLRTQNTDHALLKQYVLAGLVEKLKEVFMSTNYLKIEDIEGGFQIISISRPEALNALNSDVLNELNATFESLLGEELGANGVLITGDGEKSFIAGADIKSMIGMSNLRLKN